MKIMAFIYVYEGCDPERDIAVIESTLLKTIIVGVDSIDAGCEIAKKVVEEGCRLIELCGGFGVEGTKKVIDAIQGAVPVGYIDYFPEEKEKVIKIFRSQ